LRKPIDKNEAVLLLGQKEAHSDSDTPDGEPNLKNFRVGEDGSTKHFALCSSQALQKNGWYLNGTYPFSLPESHFSMPWYS
jgi:hypothetical protein